MLLSLSLIQRSEQAMLVRQDPVEIGKDLIAELGLLFKADNRQADVEERSEENLSITVRVSPICALSSSITCFTSCI